VTLYPVNDTLFAFRFQSFEFIGNYSNSYMYLHANAYVCSVTETGGNCNRNCLNSTVTRRRRSSDGPYSIASQYVVIVTSNTATSVGVSSSSTLALIPMTSGSSTTSSHDVTPSTLTTSPEFHTSSPTTSSTESSLRLGLPTEPTQRSQTQPMKSDSVQDSHANSKF